MSQGSEPLSRKFVAAHPSRVAQADQLAAKEGTKHVRLSSLCPPTHVYVLNPDALADAEGSVPLSAPPENEQ